MRFSSLRMCFGASLVAVLPLPLLGCETLIGANFGPKTLQTPSTSCAIHPGDATLALGDASSEPELVFAVHRLATGSETDGGVLEGLSFGFPQAELGTCHLPPDAWPQVGPNVGPTGLVNGSADAARVFQKRLLSNLDEVLRDSINAGLETTVFRLTGYNQSVNDPEVALDAFNATMVVPGSMGRDSPMPNWDGEDTWRSLPESVSRDGAGFKPRISLKASVHDGVLEMARQEGPGWLDRLQVFGMLRLASGGEWHLDGMYTGVARMKELLGIADQDQICADTSLYNDAEGSPGYKRAFCERRDADTDGDGYCDAVSLGQAFQASPAKLGCEPSDEPQHCPSSTSVLDDQCDPAPADDSGSR